MSEEFYNEAESPPDVRKKMPKYTQQDKLGRMVSENSRGNLRRGSQKAPTERSALDDAPCTREELLEETQRFFNRKRFRKIVLNTLARAARDGDVTAATRMAELALGKPSVTIDTKITTHNKTTEEKKVYLAAIVGTTSDIPAALHQIVNEPVEPVRLLPHAIPPERDPAEGELRGGSGDDAGGVGDISSLPTSVHP